MTGTVTGTKKLLYGARRLCRLALLLGVVLSGACVTPQDAQSLVVSPLGTAVVEPGEEIQIRTAAVLSSVGDLGISTQRAVALALADYGPIHGHAVSMGAAMDAQCTPEGGAAAANTITGDRRVVGVIGPSCSAAAVTASPLLSEAGLVTISPTNTAPTLTSDLRGNAGADYHRGYYRTSNNDLHEAGAIAHFAYDDLGLRSIATLHDGDPYTSGLTRAFAAAFAELGGSVTVGAVTRGQTDMAAALAEVAVEGVDGLFLPLFPDEAGRVVEQRGAVAGLAEAILLGGSALLDPDFMSLPQSEGIYLTAPDLHLEENVNEATGKSGAALVAAYVDAYHEAPTSAYLPHSYDAATLLLRAIEEVAVASGGRLYIDRARLREALTATRDFSGITGTLSCDEFGDCGTGILHVIYHSDAAITELESLPVVYYHRHAGQEE